MSSILATHTLRDLTYRYAFARRARHALPIRGDAVAMVVETFDTLGPLLVTHASVVLGCVDPRSSAHSTSRARCSLPLHLQYPAVSNP